MLPRIWSTMVRNSVIIWCSLRLAVVFSIIVHSQSDSRCFLVNGGSSVSFFVREDAPVGYNIGSLNIQGTVGKDISLVLKQKIAPVRIEPGTKNITLTRKLDKEGLEGPSSIIFTILCEKRHTNEPSLPIPVKIVVKDVNDNPPKWVGVPKEISISEQTLPGSTILSGLKATDLDQFGPYSKLKFIALDHNGKEASLVKFTRSGSEARLVLNRPLDFESVPNFTTILRVQDHGRPPLHDDTKLTVRVMDADDQNPRFQHVTYSAILPPNPKKGMSLAIEPDPIHAYDQDTGINAPLIFSLPEGRPEALLFRMDPITGRVTMAKDIIENELNQPVTLVLKAEQRDNPDRYALSTLNVGRKGSTNAPLHFVQSEFSVSVPENTPIGTILLTALTSRPTDRTLRYGIQGDNEEYFRMGPMGQVILQKSLDYEKLQKHRFRVWVTDKYQNASSTAVIDVVNINDWAPRFRKTVYEFNVSRESLGHKGSIGQLEVADGDRNDHLTLEIKNTDLIGVDNSGLLFLKKNDTMKKEMMFLVVAKDSGEPPREAFVPVVLRFLDADLVEEFYKSAEVDMKLVLISSIVLVATAFIVGIIIYFAYCRKRRKIESENFQKRVLERNISNPLVIHKLAQPNTLRRSNKIRNAVNGAAPILASTYSSAGSRGVTPVDPPSISSPHSGTLHSRAKNVTWSPKVVQKVTPAPQPPSRNEHTRVTSGIPKLQSNGHDGKPNKFELDPDTSVTPLETYRSQNPSSIPSSISSAVNTHTSSETFNGHATLLAMNSENDAGEQQDLHINEHTQSNSSLTLYF